MMAIPRKDSSEEEIKEWLNHIAVICLSDSFQKLRKELEDIYSRSDVKEPGLLAFQDALYAFMAQEEDRLTACSGKL